jgi:hypothetical protein
LNITVNQIHVSPLGASLIEEFHNVVVFVIRNDYVMIKEKEYPVGDPSFIHTHSSQQQLYVCNKTLSEVSLTVNWYHTKTFLWCWLQTFWTLGQSWCILYKEVKGVLEVCQVWCIRMRVDGLYSTHNKEWGTMPSTQHVQSNNSTYNSFKNDTGQSAYQSSFRSRFLVSLFFVMFFFQVVEMGNIL